MSKNLNRQPEAANLNSEKTKDIRMTNIIAARGKRFSQVFPVQFNSFGCLFQFLAVADVVRTSLGPRGMDKMVSPETSPLKSNLADPRYQRQSIDHQRWCHNP
jgi:hypothetical protein